MVLFSILSLYIITHIHSISLETFSIFLANFEFCRLSQLLANFLCKERTATKLPQYISPAKPYFSSSDIAIIPYAVFTYLQIPPRPDHLHGQNLPPRRTESAMLTEHYTTVVSNSPPELFHRHSGLQALCLSHKLVCAKVTAGDVDFLSAKSSEQFRYREFQNHST